MHQTDISMEEKFQVIIIYNIRNYVCVMSFSNLYVSFCKDDKHYEYYYKHKQM